MLTSRGYDFQIPLVRSFQIRKMCFFKTLFLHLSLSLSLSSLSSSPFLGLYLGLFSVSLPLPQSFDMNIMLAEMIR